MVWHGFTQMGRATPTTRRSSSIRAEGHEVVDGDGNRYLDAISSLWVNTLGHHVPELDDAIRGQLDRGAHTTMLGNGNQIVVELSEALARVVPVDDPHFLYASDGASAVEQALKIAFQYWVNHGVEGRTTFLAFGGAYHGDTIGALSLGDGGFGTALFDPLRFPVLRAPGFAEPACFERACRDGRRARVGARSGDRRAARAGRGGDAARGSRRDHATSRPRVASTTCSSSTTRSRPGSAARERSSRPSSASRPDLLCLGKGHDGRLPPDVGDGRVGPGVRRLPRAPTSASARCTTGTRTAGTPSRPRSRSATSSSSTRATCSPTSASGRTSCAACSTTGSRRSPRGRGRSAARPHGRRRARAADRRAALGPSGLRRGGRAWRAPPPARRRRRADAAARPSHPRSCTGSCTPSTERDRRSRGET